MIDPTNYRDLLMARVEAVKADMVEKRDVVNKLQPLFASLAAMNNLTWTVLKKLLPVEWAAALEQFREVNG